MFWRWLAIFLALSLGYAGIFLLNFWHLKHASERTIFGLQFSSYWTYLSFLIFVTAPLILAINYFFFSAYYFGYKVWYDIFGNKFWIINLTNSASTFFILLVLTWLCFQELPSKGTLAGFILAIAAILVSVFWK